MPLPQPARGRDSHRDPGAGRDVLEARLAEVLEEREGLVRERGLEDVGPAVVVDVARIRPHARDAPRRFR